MFFNLENYALNIQFSATSAAMAAVLETATVVAATSTPQVPQGGAGEQQQQEQQQQHSRSTATAMKTITNHRPTVGEVEIP